MEVTGPIEMRYLTIGILFVVGLINFYPVIGVISAERLVSLYGISFENADLIILMRHRAVLFGLLGALIVASAFRPSLQHLACVAGLVSMVSFVLLAFLVGGYGAALNKVVVADLLASVGLIVVLILRRWAQR